MEFGIHNYRSHTDRPIIDVHPDSDIEHVYTFVHIDRARAKDVIKYADRHGIDSSHFSWVTGAYVDLPEKIPDDIKGNIQLPDKILERSDVEKLDGFCDKIISHIDQNHDIKGIKSRFEGFPTIDEARNTLEEDEYLAYQSYGHLKRLRRLTSGALERDLELYYGEVDPEDD